MFHIRSIYKKKNIDAKSCERKVEEWNLNDLVSYERKEYTPKLYVKQPLSLITIISRAQNNTA